MLWIMYGPSSTERGTASSAADDSEKHIDKVRRWTQRVPIGLGLCPWAGKSQRMDRLRYALCDGTTTDDTTRFVWDEIKRLCDQSKASADAEWSTTLVICPHVEEWQNDFVCFDEYVKIFEVNLKKKTISSTHADQGLDVEKTLGQITFVAFHPRFVRWHALPDDIGIGSLVQSHRGMCGFAKSWTSSLATVIETSSSNFGRRKVKVRFNEDGKAQYVPIDWVVCDAEGNPLTSREPLPDNAMHRAPYPTIHLIRNVDLASLSARDVSRVKRKNAALCARLGWERIQAKAENRNSGDIT